VEVIPQLGIPGYEARAVFGSVGIPKFRELVPAGGFGFQLDADVGKL